MSAQKIGMPAPQKTGVSVYRVYRSDTPIHLQKPDTPGDTQNDTPSLKSLAYKYLSNEKAIQPAIQKPIHSGKKCIAGEEGRDTLLEAENRAAHPQKNLSKPARSSGNKYIDYRRASCDGYPGQCAGCPDAQLYHLDEHGEPYALRSDFCKRHPRPEWAVLQ